MFAVDLLIERRIENTRELVFETENTRTCCHGSLGVYQIPVGWPAFNDALARGIRESEILENDAGLTSEITAIFRQARPHYDPNCN